MTRALDDAGYQVVATAPGDRDARDLKAVGCEFVHLPMDNKGTSAIKDLVLLLNYLRVLRQERPDVFLSFTIKPNIFGSIAARILRIPVVNNISGLGTAFIRNTWLTVIAKLLYRVALPPSKVVFFQNQDDRDLFLRNKIVRSEQALLLPGSGVDLKRFCPRPSPSPNGGEIRFLLIARLIWDKGVGEFVEAARLVKSRHAAARFQLLGFVGVENRTSIPKETVDGWVNDGVVEYLGATDDVRDYIAACHCVVLPSYREGTSRSLLEGAAMAKPLIATDVPGCRGVVDQGKNGFLCKARDVGDLAHKMCDFLDLTDEARIQMGQESRRKVEREYDERIVIRSYLETIEKILESKQRSS